MAYCDYIWIRLMVEILLVINLFYNTKDSYSYTQFIYTLTTILTIYGIVHFLSDLSEKKTRRKQI